MESSLFMELSNEQQELVSGGGQLTELYDELYTEFYREDSVVRLIVDQGSGPNGSYNRQSFGQDFTEIDTEAYKDFYAIFD